MPKVTLNNINIAYEIHGSGEPLALVHGGQGDSNTFNNIIPDLAKTFTVLSFDQRGAGDSDKPDMEYSMALFADDIEKLMNHVGFQSAHLFGISLGGMITQEFAIRYPSKTRSIILGCTLPGGWSHAVKVEHSNDVMVAFSSDETITPEVRASALARVAFMPGYSEKHPEIIDTLIAERKEKPIDKIGITRRLETIAKYNAYDQLSQINCPVLIITGKNDQLVAWQNSNLIAKQIPNSELVILENAGHIFWVEQKEKTLEKLFTFIQKLNR